MFQLFDTIINPENLEGFSFRDVKKSSDFVVKNFIQNLKSGQVPFKLDTLFLRFELKSLIEWKMAFTVTSAMRKYTSFKKILAPKAYFSYFANLKKKTSAKNYVALN